MGLQMQFINNFVCPNWVCAAGVNNNNNMGMMKTHSIFIFIIDISSTVNTCLFLNQLRNKQTRINV